MGRYDWDSGILPEIGIHSISKHKVISAYLERYFQTLTPQPGQERISLTLVDGFSGGGAYLNEVTREIHIGSPLIMLKAAKDAAIEVNRDRTQPVIFDLKYFFIDEDPAAIKHLRKILIENGYGGEIGKSIEVIASDFSAQSSRIIEAIKGKNPKNGRSIFLLDQYGYTDVPTSMIASILRQLPTAEIILTFAVDALISFLSDTSLSRSIVEKSGLSHERLLDGLTMEERKTHPEFRRFIQSKVCEELIAECGAPFFTPFFIHNSKGHGDYWLVHLSQHPKARDVMTGVHWDQRNTFRHFAGPGINMFNGYDPNNDFELADQRSFDFGDEAEGETIRALIDQLPRLIFASGDGITLESLYRSTCNGSPADLQRYKMALGELMLGREITVTSPKGGARRAALRIGGGDLLAPSKQLTLFSGK